MRNDGVIGAGNFHILVILSYSVGDLLYMYKQKNCMSLLFLFLAVAYFAKPNPLEKVANRWNPCSVKPTRLLWEALKPVH